MVLRGGAHAPTWRASCPPHLAGVGSGAKGNGGHPVGIYQRQAEGTVGQQVGRACVVTGGKRSGQRDSPFNAKTAVSKGRVVGPGR